MEAISAWTPSAAPVSPAAGRRENETPRDQQPGNTGQSRPQTPRMDEYIPEETRERPSAAQRPERSTSGSRAESCTVNTDQVDREIEKLKRMKTELEQQINAETDTAKRETLEKKLAQVELELRQKDNDAYRRQHAAYTYA